MQTKQLKHQEVTQLLLWPMPTLGLVKEANLLPVLLTAKAMVSPPQVSKVLQDSLINNLRLPQLLSLLPIKLPNNLQGLSKYHLHNPLNPLHNHLSQSNNPLNQSNSLLNLYNNHHSQLSSLLSHSNQFNSLMSLYQLSQCRMRLK